MWDQMNDAISSWVINWQHSTTIRCYNLHIHTYIQGVPNKLTPYRGQKTATSTFLAATSAKLWLKIVKSSSTLAATFFNVFAENNGNTWFKSNAIGISFIHTDVPQWQVQSAVTVSVGISWIDKNRVIIIEPKWTVQVYYYQYVLCDCYPTFLQNTSATCGPCRRTARRHTLPTTPWCTCDVRTERPLSLE